MALLESDIAAAAHALGAVPKYPAPHAFMRPTAKPKARLPRPQDAGSAESKRKVAAELPCCKARRLSDAMTDLDKRMLAS